MPLRMIIDPTYQVAVKGALTVASAGIVGVALDGLDIKFIIYLVVLIGGIIGTAAVMRYRMGEVESKMAALDDDLSASIAKTDADLNAKIEAVQKRQKDYDDKAEDYRLSQAELHRQLSVANATLSQIMKDQQRRITELEAHLWRVSKTTI